MKLQHTILVAGILLGTFVSGFAQHQSIPAAPPGYVEGELLVKFRGGPRGQAAERVRSAQKHKVKRQFDFIGWQQIDLPRGMTVAEGLARYGALADVLTVEPNSLMQASDSSGGGVTGRGAAGEGAGLSTLNDPLLRQQWALERIGAPVAWAITNGSTNVVVGIIDTGINYRHDDLRDNMWRNPGEIPGNGIDDDGNGFVDDVYGIDTADDGLGNDSNPDDEGFQVGSVLHVFHGTACAGILGAMAGNGKGIAGVAGSVQLMALRAVKTNNNISNADTIQALDYAVSMKRRGVNLRVISMSFGGGDSFSQAQKDAHDRVASEGILQVNGVHNNALDLDLTPRYPASYTTSNFVTVAASEGFDGLASFSNFGRNTVDLAAPGIAIVSTYGPATNDYTLHFNGTSAACPHVAGVAALLAAAFPNLTARQLQDALLDSVDVVPLLTNRVATGGRLNVARTLYRLLSNAAPVVVSQSQNQAVPPGSGVEVRVSVAGTEPLRFQWSRNDAEFADATNAALKLPNVTTNDAGNYFVIASNEFGMVTSVVATLTIVREPVDFTRITSGSIVTTSGNAIAAAWADYNQDGFLDLFVTTGVAETANLLYRNNGNGTFTAVAPAGVATDAGDSWGCAWGDYDNDGHLDLFVANGGNVGPRNNFLYRNEGNGTFTRVTSNAGSLASDLGASLDCAWADFDNDGWLDLYVANGRLEGTHTNFLYRNTGNGAFVRITEGAPMTDGGRYFSTAVGDYDGDGLMDVFVANGWGLPNALYRNNGEGTFTRSSALEALMDPAFTTSAAWGDYDNDGDLDLFVARYSHSLLLRNEGGGAFTRILSGEPAEDIGDADNAAWIDYDNDGWLDLFVSSESGPNRLYHNQGAGMFRRVTTGGLATDIVSSISAAWGDYDNDGFPDLFVTYVGHANLLYHNGGNSNHWLRVKCQGTVSNRSAIGAKVRVKALIGGDERWQLREIAKGGGFSQPELVAAFGLGDATNASLVRIEWPSGRVQELTNVGPNQVLAVTEPGLGITQPRDISVRLGGTTNLSVSAWSDQPILGYQWRFNGTNLPGRTSASLPVANAQLVDEGDYTVVVSSGLYSVTSRVAQLTVLITPVILQPPLSRSVVKGGDLTVSVSVSGHPAPFGYLWRRGTSNLTFIVRSETNCFFTLTNIQTDQGGLHRVIITNAAAPTLSVNATFTLNVLADGDGDGLPDVWEAAYPSADNPALDADGDGLTNLQEYLAGTNPTNGLSSLRIDQFSASGAVALEFLAVSNRTYSVEIAGQLENTDWSKLADVPARSTNWVERISAPVAGATRFYRLATPRRP